MALYTVPFKKEVTSSQEKTLVLIKPGVSTVKIRQIDVSFDSAGATAGVVFELCRMTSYTGGTATSTTAVKTDPRDEKANSEIFVVKDLAEPTLTGVETIATYYLQPLGGLLPLPFPYGSEILVPNKETNKGLPFGLRCISQAATVAHITGQVWFEE